MSQLTQHFVRKEVEEEGKLFKQLEEKMLIFAEKAHELFSGDETQLDKVKERAKALGVVARKQAVLREVAEDADFDIEKSLEQLKKELNKRVTVAMAEDTSDSLEDRVAAAIASSVGEDREDDAEEEDDDRGTVDTLPLDPITKMPLSDPVKNARCGHVYGKAAMVALIQGSASVRCPIVGCSNKRPIQQQDLVEDQATAKAIRKAKARAASQK